MSKKETPNEKTLEIVLLKKALSEIIADEVQNTIEEGQKEITIIEEKAELHGLHSVTLTKISQIYFAFKPDDDKYRFLNQLIKKSELLKSVDTILFCSVRGKNYVFLIELKSSERKKLAHKYKSARVLVDFIKSALKIYFDNNSLDTFQVKSVLLDTRATKKVTILNTKGEIYYHKGFGNRRRGETPIQVFTDESKMLYPNQ